MIGKLFKDYQRIDGRDVYEYRNISIRFPKNINKPNKTASCLVSFGKTSVFARVSCNVVEPKSNHPNRGLINLNLDTSFLKNNSNKLRDDTEEALRLEPTIKDCLRDALDMDALCISAGERVFCINIDIKVQTDDGNLLDVIVFAALLGLKTFKRPDVTIDESGQIIVHEDTTLKDPVSLQMKELPVFVTLGVAVESNLIVIDLNKLEEDTLDCKMVVGMTPTGSICTMNPLGSNMWIDQALSDRIIQLAHTKVVGLQHLISQAVIAQESSPESVVINSTSFLPNHPVFTADRPEEIEVSTIHDAPEVLEVSDDMEIDSDNDALEQTPVDDWNRIDSLMSQLDAIAYPKKTNNK